MSVSTDEISHKCGGIILESQSTQDTTAVAFPMKPVYNP